MRADAFTVVGADSSMRSCRPLHNEEKRRRKKDHNYVAPPPCTPPPSPLLTLTPTKTGPSQIPVEDVSYHTTVTTSGLKEVVVTTSGSTDVGTGDDNVTRCICDFQHDDGYMICCDRCGVWQHVDCMRVDRQNIPDSYLCELCEPRPVDKHRAIQIQTKKRDDLSLLPMDSSATETEDETTQDDAVQHARRKGRKDMDEASSVTSKKRVKRGHKEESPRKKLNVKARSNGLTDNKVLASPQKPLLSRHQSFNTGSNDGFFGRDEVLNGSGNGLVSTSSTEALFAAVECVKSYQDATCNCYTPELQNLLASIRFNGQHTCGPPWPPILSCAEISSQLASQQPCRVAAVTSGKMGLEATDDIITHQPLTEYVGNVMLRDQYDRAVSPFESIQPFVLFYTKLDGLDLCVDARLYGNEARFVRRSCTPNAEVRHVLDGCTVRFFLHATKSIIRGAEITIPFDFNYHKCLNYVECACTRLSCPVIKYQKQGSTGRRQRSTRSVDSKLSLTTLPDSSSVPQATTPVKTVPQSTTSAQRSKKLPALHIANLPPVPLPSIDSEVVTVEAESSYSKMTAAQTSSPVKVPRLTRSTGSAPASAAVTDADQRAPFGANQSDSDDGEKNKKKTRDERKLEAIVKAIERMEKREERKKEALARQEQSKKMYSKDRETALVKTEPELSSATGSSAERNASPSTTENKIKVEQPAVKSEPAPKKKGRHGSYRKHSTNSMTSPPAAASSTTTTTTPPTSVSNTLPPCSASPPIGEFRPTTSVQDSSVSTSDTAAVDTVLAPPSDKPVRFQKKLMRVSGSRSELADVRKPLTIQTNGPEVPENSVDADEYITCVPSPHTLSLSNLRRDSASGKMTVGVPAAVAAGDSRGSAKKVGY